MKSFLTICLIVLAVIAVMPSAQGQSGFLPGERVLFEAHNCYPYNGLWNNRIDKALDAGFPLAIEMDVMWYVNKETNEGRLVVAHSEPLTGEEPTLKEYFFERVRPYMENALASEDKKDWPLITLNINDIRSNSPEAFAEVWALTETYQSWLCTAPKNATPDSLAPMNIKPLLILSGSGRHEMKQFYDAIPEDGNLRIFGSGNPKENADNFRRWINYSWSAVEPEGQSKATAWNEEKEKRLRGLVKDAHEHSYWIRFYSLNGHPVTATARLGLSPGYNFGDLDTVKVRWEKAKAASVDFIATDQIEEAKN